MSCSDCLECMFYMFLDYYTKHIILVVAAAVVAETTTIICMYLTGNTTHNNPTIQVDEVIQALSRERERKRRRNVCMRVR